MGIRVFGSHDFSGGYVGYLELRISGSRDYCATQIWVLVGICGFGMCLGHVTSNCQDKTVS